MFNSILFWGTLGPLQLLLTLVVFSLHGSLTPFIWAGFISSILLGICVTIGSLLEAASLFLTQKKQIQNAQSEFLHLKSSFQEIQISKLEEKETMQNTLQRIQQKHEEEMKQQHSSYGKVCAENFESKNKQLALQASLEAALEELGQVRQLIYLRSCALPSPVEEKVDEMYFFDHVHTLQEEALALEQEITALQEIITHLLTEKKVSRLRKAKKENQPTLLEKLLN